MPIRLPHNKNNVQFIRQQPDSPYYAAEKMPSETHSDGIRLKKQLIQGRLIRFQNHFHRLVFGGVFEHVVGFFQFAEFETVGHHFGVID